MPLYRYAARFPSGDHRSARPVRISLEPHQVGGREAEALARAAFRSAGIQGEYVVEEAPIPNLGVEAHLKASIPPPASNLDLRPRYVITGPAYTSVTPDGVRYAWQRFNAVVFYAVTTPD